MNALAAALSRAIHAKNPAGKGGAVQKGN